MKENWKSVVMALAIFCAGLGTGILTQHPFAGWRAHRPPFGEGDRSRFPIMHEFRRADMSMPMPPPMGGNEQGPDLSKGFFEPPPEVKAYEEKIDAIVASYRSKMRFLLTEKQQADFDKLLDMPPMPPPPPFTGDKSPEHKESREGGVRQNNHMMMPVGGGVRFIGMVVYKPVLEFLSDELKLNEKQKAACESLLQERRAELLKFVDSNPPPTIKFRLKQK